MQRIFFLINVYTYLLVCTDVQWASLVAQGWRICLQYRSHRRCGFNPGWKRSPGGGHGNPLQYSCLENPMDRGAWWATVCGVTRVWHDWATRHTHIEEQLNAVCICVQRCAVGCYPRGFSALIIRPLGGCLLEVTQRWPRGHTQPLMGDETHCHSDLPGKYVSRQKVVFIILSFVEQRSREAQILSVQFSHSDVSDSLRPHESQHARPPCPSPAPGVYPNSCPLSRWCHPAISSSVIPFSSCPQSLPASGSFPWWVNSWHEVAKVLEFQLQHQSFQWTPRTNLL